MVTTLKNLKAEYEQFYWDCHRENKDVANVFINFCELAAKKYSNITVKPSEAVTIGGNFYLLNNKKSLLSCL